MQNLCPLRTIRLKLKCEISWQFLVYKPSILHIYTGCPRRNGQNFGGVFLVLKYTDITQNTYVQS